MRLVEYSSIIPGMNEVAEFDAFDLDPSVQRQLAELVERLVSQANEEASARLQSLEAQLAAKEAELQVKDLKIQALTLELAHIRRIRYGAKSEALSVLQQDLFLEALDGDRAAIEAEVEQLTRPGTIAAKPKRPRAGRQSLPSHLPRIEHRHEPEACTCGRCGQDLVKIGEDVSEQLDVEPAKFFVHRHIRPQYACRQCETVHAAPIPPAVIDGGLAAPGLLTWVIVGKYLDHLPLYRLEQIAARDEVVLARSTLAEWVGRVGFALQPLADRLIRHLLHGNTLHVDETPVAQLDPGSGKTRKAYLWAYRSNDLEPGPRIIVFDYQTGRGGQHARQFLDRWQGYLLVDDYGGYKALFVPSTHKPSADVVELGCWAHVRRKFFDLYQANASPMALEALQRIGVLYAIEADAIGFDHSARQQARAEHSRPALDAFYDWLHQNLARTAPGSGSAKALNYTLKRWLALIRYAETGHLPIDNNPVENAIRTIALGKKNWLFVGSERAGRRAAAIQSLLGTAKLNGLDPATWLKDTLDKLPAWPNSRIDELLPFAPRED
jgi:transposase